MERSVVLTAALSVAAPASGLVLMTASSVAASSLPTLTLSVSKNNVVVGAQRFKRSVGTAAP